MRTKRPNAARATRQIVGISLAPELAARVKSEAKRRRIRLRALFESLWAQYQKSGSHPVSTKPVHHPTSRTRQIVGFSMSPELAAKVKSEARRRHLSLRSLFDDLWAYHADTPQNE